MNRRRICSFAGLVAVCLLGTSAARAEIVRGTITFTDGDGTPAPVRRAPVRVTRNDGANASATTNDAGEYAVNIPFVAVGMTYTTTVFASNPAAKIYPVNAYTGDAFSRVLGPPGTPLLGTSTGTTTPITVSFLLGDAPARDAFNMADAILRGFDYANLRRDPNETDPINQVTVFQPSIDTTYYDAISHVIRFNPARALDDFTVIHEYAHYLEEQISKFVAIGAFFHDGCTATGFAGADVRSFEYAWMEGFATYFAEAVAQDAGFDAFGPRVDGAAGGNLSGRSLELPFCPGLTGPRDRSELFVAAALIDIIDAGTSESGDVLCAERQTIANDTLIFQIFDRELDLAPGDPTLLSFITGWVGRGLDLPSLRSTLSASSIVPSVLPAPNLRYGNDPAANLAVWRPGTQAFWHILRDVDHADTVINWGTTGDKPVPADYDGDHFTDVAVFRNGTWFLRLSAAGVDRVESWGTFGDIPLPGDYDGDGDDEIAVYRPANGYLYIFEDTCTIIPARYLGYGTPFKGRFLGSPRDEPGVFDGHQFILTRMFGAVIYREMGGYGSPTPAIGDYDGDGFDDFTVYRRTSGGWDRFDELNGGFFTTWWGYAGDIPVPADYDGDGATDFAVWTPVNGEWNIAEADGDQWWFQWGANGDVPVPAP